MENKREFSPPSEFDDNPGFRDQCIALFRDFLFMDDPGNLAEDIKTVLNQLIYGSDFDVSHYRNQLWTIHYIMEFLESLQDIDKDEWDHSIYQREKYSCPNCQVLSDMLDKSLAMNEAERKFKEGSIDIDEYSKFIRGFKKSNDKNIPEHQRIRMLTNTLGIMALCNPANSLDCRNDEGTESFL